RVATDSMRSPMAMCMVLATIFWAITAELRGGEPADALGTWSAFGKIDLQKLSAGKTVTRCNASMKFARGLCAQAAYLVVAPLDVTSGVLLDSDPTKHAELDTYQ